MKRWFIPLAILALALAVRLSFLFQFSHSPFAQLGTSGLDDSFYDQWAESIARGDWVGHGVFYGMPLYPYFLGMLYLVFGHSLLVVKLCQILFGGISCVLVYLIGKRAFNTTVGAIAGLLLAFYGISVLYEGLLIGASLAILLNLLSILFLMRAVDSQGWKWWIASGVILGLACLNSGSSLLFLPLAAVWAAVFVGMKGQVPAFERFGRSVAALAIVILAALAMIAPVTLRNYLVGKDYVPITWHSGLNFYIGNNADADGTFKSPAGINPSVDKMMLQSRAVAEQAMGRRLKPSEVSRYWFRRTFESWKAAGGQGSYLHLLGRKFLLFWNAYEVYDVIDYSFVKSRVPILWLTFVGFGLVGALGLLGMFLPCRSGRRDCRVLLYLFVLSQMLSVLAYFVNSRYRLPVVPVLGVFAGFACWWCYERLRAKQFAAVGAAGVGLVALFLLTYIRLFSVDLAVSHNNLGDIYKRKGLWQVAAQEFQEAIRLNPDIQEVHSNLAEVYRALNRRDLAIQEYEESIRIRPNYGVIYYDLGTTYYEMGRLDDAATNFQRAIALNPHLATAHNNLACVYLAQDRREEAIAEFKRALAVDPNLKSACDNLALLEKKGIIGNNRVIH